jgi:hypothetical protein
MLRPFMTMMDGFGESDLEIVYR